MSPEALNLALFGALNMTGAGSGAVAALEALAVVPVWLLPVVVGGTWLLGGRVDRETAVRAVVSAGLSMALAHAASVLVDHPRPFVLDLAPNVLGHAADSSFPSDHATLFFALAMTFASRPVSGLPGLASCLACMGLGVGFARIALGVHFPLDVVGSVGIGGMAALVSDVVLRRPAALVFACGERLRRLVGPLASRDGREKGGTRARPSC